MFRRFYYSFPIQLAVLHLRSNLLMLFLWGILMLIVSGSVGRKYGMHYLFLDPEYLGDVSFWSFFFVGFALSGFVMAWHTATYLINSYRFPFLATLERPFACFCLNNSVIPCFFVGFYLWEVISFQWYNELLPEYGIIFDCLGLLVGLAWGMLLTSAYFNFTNRNFNYFLNIDKITTVTPRLRRFFNRRNAEEKDISENFKDAFKVKYYVTERLRMRRVRPHDEHAENYALLDRVYRQNHSNALVIQIAGITLLVTMGIFMEYKAVRIPAGASILILFTIIATVLGALTYWLREWRAFFLLGLFAIVNQFIGMGLIDRSNKAYGLDYSHKIIYSNHVIDSLTSISNYAADVRATTQILNNWRGKFSSSTFHKPKLVMISASGGGLRAAAWTTRVVQVADSITQGRLMKQSILMTGASGGMLGLGYVRELYLRSLTDKSVNLSDYRHYKAICQDIVNSIGFAILANDLFVPWIHFDWKGHRYLKDRGYIFEQQFNENTGDILNKTIGDYAEPEAAGLIPMYMATPVITNDGRQLIISSQYASYMTQPRVGFEIGHVIENDAVEFLRLFENNDAKNLRFLTALRMNATYPYILPNVYLPTYPQLQVMDAGFRDNFGLKSAYRFTHTFKEWIRQNTDGVVFVQIRGDDKYQDIMAPDQKDTDGLLKKAFGGMAPLGNFIDIQDYANDDYFNYLRDIVGDKKIDLVRLTYKPSPGAARAQMSFHLTTREKLDISNAIYIDENQKALRRLRELVK